MTAYRKTYRFGGIRIGVETSDPADLVWMGDFLHPAFASDAGAPDWTVRLFVDSARYDRLTGNVAAGDEITAFLLDSGERRLPAWQDRGPGQLVHESRHQVFYRVYGRRVLLLARTGHRRVRLPLMRAIRELAMDAAQQEGGLFLHAAAFAVSGRAAIITGPKESGKTSLLTYALQRMRSDFLSNDRLLLAQTHGHLLARAMPTIVAIRSGTLSLFPQLRKTIEHSGFRLGATLAECASLDGPFASPSRDGKSHLTPAQFCRACHCDAVGEAVPSLVLFPHRTGRPGGLRLHPVGQDRAVRRLEKCHFGASAGQSGPNRRRSGVFRLPWTTPDLKVCGEQVLEKLLRQIPAYDCELGTDAFSDSRGAEALVRLLTDGS